MGIWLSLLGLPVLWTSRLTEILVFDALGVYWAFAAPNRPSKSFSKRPCIASIFSFGTP